MVMARIDTADLLPLQRRHPPMCKFPSQEEVAYLRRKYPEGTRITLKATLVDPFAEQKPGDMATVKGVDDGGAILCKWDNGSSLSLIPRVDKFEVQGVTDEVYEEIMQLRRLSDCTNMLSVREVFELAIANDMLISADFIFENTYTFTNFILTGKRHI
jgi:hypothetical protein